MRALLARLLALFHRRQRDHELSDEMSTHLELSTADLVASGLSLEDARRAAALRFGGTLQTAEAYRDQQGFSRLESLWQDVRYAVRTLRKNPAFATTAGATLALAIGAQTSVYCLIATLFVRPPAGVTEAQRLVAISALNRGVPVEDTIRYPDYLYYRDHNTTFSELASHFNSGVALADTERAEELNAHVVSANYFSVLGVSPHVGRFFLSVEDVAPGRNPVVVLSHSFWQRRFAADPTCVDTVLKLNGVSFTIIGVGPSGFDGAKAGWPVDVFVPNTMAHIASPGLVMLSRNSARLDLIGRLKPGRTFEEARAEMRGLASQLETAHAESRDAGLFVSALQGIHPQARPAAARFAQLLAATVTCLLVIACANLAGLLLARNTTRHKEITIRLALGAGRARIVRQLLFESVLLSVCGGLVGLLFASWGNVLLAGYYGTEIAGVRHSYALTIDRAALLLTMAVAMATGIAFGVLPAVLASRTALIPALKRDAALQGFCRSRLGTAFLVAQVSISVVLVIGAALLIHSVRTLRSDPGFDVEHVAYFRMKPRLSGYDQEKASRYFRDLQRHLESLGEVESVAFVRFPPALPPRAVPDVPVYLPGHAPSAPDETIRVPQHLVTLGFFETLSIPIVSGRAFDARDSQSGRQSVVVDQVLAARLWPDTDPIGQTLFVQGKPHEVIGVAQYKGVRPGGAAPGASLFRADWASATGSGRMLVRVKGDSRTMLPLLRQKIVAVDPNVALSEALSLSRLIENMYAEVPLAMRVVGYAGGLGLLLTAIGLYGVLALAVGQRTREIGVRMALGARVPSILSLILREGIALALAGLALGLTSATVLSRLLTRFLYGVTPTDPVTFGVAIVLVGGVALAACAIPAWRAARVDPMVALRYE
jgi:putative ABC transport system permease protein